MVKAVHGLHEHEKYTLWSELCMGYTNMNKNSDLYYDKSKNSYRCVPSTFTGKRTGRRVELHYFSFYNIKNLGRGRGRGGRGGGEGEGRGGRGGGEGEGEGRERGRGGEGEGGCSQRVIAISRSLFN